ncbi:MAG TPA: hypothetical protein VF686_07750, partial [Brevundimonas sp.]
GGFGSRSNGERPSAPRNAERPSGGFGSRNAERPSGGYGARPAAAAPAQRDSYGYRGPKRERV